MTSDTRERPTAPFHDSDADRIALIILDMINCFDFAGAEELEPRAALAAQSILDLRSQADAADCPVIYVNDNFGEWHSEASKLSERAIAVGSSTAKLLRPRDDDYFIIKPQYSGFYSTNLGVLLPKLGVRRLILTGIAADICVLFTAADAAMRDYMLWVPSDAIASEDERRRDAALSILRNGLGAETRPTGELSLYDWKAVGNNESRG